MKRVYEALKIPLEDQEMLGCRNYDDLLNKRKRLDSGRLRGVSIESQGNLASVVKYIESLGVSEESDSGDALEKFSSKGFFDFEFNHFDSDDGLEPDWEIAAQQNKEARTRNDARYEQEPNVIEGHGDGGEDDDEGEDGLDEAILDLSDEERRLAKEDVAKTEFHMMLQGFSQNGDSSESNAEQDTGSCSGPKVGPELVIHNGKTFRVGHCYEYRQSADATVTVAILSFQRSTSNLYDAASCVWVVPKSMTILGDAAPDTYFQVRLENVLSLDHFLEECKEPVQKPRWIYEPQEQGDWHTVGYVYDNDGSNRVGLRKDLKAIDLFCGAGGMHLGYQAAGVETLIAVDKSAAAIRTFATNNADVPFYEGDVLSFLEEYSNHYKPDIVHGSPPCQGFSSANRFGGQHDEDNRRRSMDWVEAIRKIRPLICVYENVEGMWQEKHSHYIRDIMAALSAMDYQVRCMVLKACDYGDPQERRRVFLVAAKTFVSMPDIPRPTHGDGPNLQPFVRCANVLDALQTADPVTTPNMLVCRTSTNVPGDSSGCTQLDPEGFAGAVRAGGPPVLHYAARVKNSAAHDRSSAESVSFRCLTVRECAALQGFPNDYEFFGTQTAQYRQVGNAVPVGLATAVAKSVADVLRFVYRQETDTN